MDLHSELAVRERYSAASQEVEPALCCPVQYDPKLLAVLPQELIERDYGCGDPTPYVREGEVVLDLGSGGGKICYIASQIVGARGRVIGIDMNDDMLALARKYQQEIGSRIGWHNVEFYKGRIQDLQLPLEVLERRLAEQPVSTATGWVEMQRVADELRTKQPLVASRSVDVILSNCVLNLVTLADREQLFRELFRVLRPGGRAVISDIVCNQPVPKELQNDPRLWSGCISGAFVEGEFLAAFSQSGFVATQIVTRQAEPWQTVAGIEFRSVTVRAYKPLAADLLASPAPVLYRGPWKSVIDESGRTFHRGVPVEISGAERARFAVEPFRDELISVGELASNGSQPSSSCCQPGKCC